MRSWRRRVLALLLAALVASCGGGDGGGGGGSPPPAGLSGTWFGTLEDADLFLSTASVTISGGNITQVLIDGFNTGLTGTLTQQSAQVMRYTLTDGVDTLTMALLTDFSSFFTEAAATATCAFSTTLTCNVTDPSGTFNVDLAGAFDARGRWQGTYTGPTNGDANVFMSADKTFAAAWACDLPDQFWPDDCAFYALHR
jgi:hypothetical protein